MTTKFKDLRKKPKIIKCDVCKGKGEVHDDREGASGHNDTVVCPHCRGAKGYFYSKS